MEIMNCILVESNSECEFQVANEADAAADKTAYGIVIV
jgi:hypothetical protein